MYLYFTKENSRQLSIRPWIPFGMNGNEKKMSEIVLCAQNGCAAFECNWWGCGQSGNYYQYAIRWSTLWTFNHTGNLLIIFILIPIATLFVLFLFLLDPVKFMRWTDHHSDILIMLDAINITIILLDCNYYICWAFLFYCLRWQQDSRRLIDFSSDWKSL